MADNIKDYQMSDAIWNFVYPYDGKERTNQEKQQEEEIRQKQSLELMHQYQQYYGMVEKNKYVLRESVLSCQYGTKYAKLDCEEDHGVYKHMKPVMAITDCANNNIHNFGSCLCPEANYVGRLPMTNEVDNMGVPAIKAPQNKRAHICVPIISENSVWHQVDSNALIGVKQKGYAPMLLDNAVLVCQYGGIIGIKEIPNTSGNIKRMSLSEKGLKLLKYHENNISTIKGWGLGKYNGSNLIGIYPHYVFRPKGKSGQWESDGGITFGFGHYVSRADYIANSEDKILVDTYTKGASITPSNVPSNGVPYVVPGSAYMGIKDVEDLLKKDVVIHEKELSDKISEFGFNITQEQFDALINLRYHKHRLGKSIDGLLSTSDYDKSKWDMAIKGLIGPKGDTKRAQELVDLFNSNLYPAGI